MATRPTKNNFLRARSIGALTAADVDIEPFTGAILCTTAGNAVITDLSDVVTTVPLLAGQSYSITSLGSDGALLPAAPTPWINDPYDPDIALTDGQFVQAPTGQ